MSAAVRKGNSVLVDTNVIIESYRTSTWRALTGGNFRVETVADCVTETQTGFQLRRPELTIDIDQLKHSLFAVNSVGDKARTELAIKIRGIALDRG